MVSVFSFLSFVVTTSKLERVLRVLVLGSDARVVLEGFAPLLQCCSTR